MDESSEPPDDRQLCGRTPRGDRLAEKTSNSHWHALTIVRPCRGRVGSTHDEYVANGRRGLPVLPLQVLWPAFASGERGGSKTIRHGAHSAFCSLPFNTPRASSDE